MTFVRLPLKARFTAAFHQILALNPDSPPTPTQLSKAIGRTGPRPNVLEGRLSSLRRQLMAQNGFEPSLFPIRKWPLGGSRIRWKKSVCPTPGCPQLLGWRDFMAIRCCRICNTEWKVSGW